MEQYISPVNLANNSFIGVKEAGKPTQVHVKVSEDDGNALALKDNGLYVSDQSAGMASPKYYFLDLNANTTPQSADNRRKRVTVFGNKMALIHFDGYVSTANGTLGSLPSSCPVAAALYQQMATIDGTTGYVWIEGNQRTIQYSKMKTNTRFILSMLIEVK